MRDTPPSAHPVSFFFKGKKKCLPWESMAAQKMGEGVTQGVNKLLPVGWEACMPLVRGEERMEHKTTCFTSVVDLQFQGTEPCCPIRSAVSWPLLMPGYGYAHMAYWDIPWT
jgi:hypothetical protein